MQPHRIRSGGDFLTIKRQNKMTTFKELLEQIEKQALILKNLHEKVEKLAKDYIEDTIPKKKNYTWEECFQNGGFYLDSDSVILETYGITSWENNKNIATTEKIIKSHLAACQLSHIIEAINKDFEDNGQCGYAVYFQGCLNMSNTIDWALPRLNSPQAFDCLVKHHTPLLKQYLGVE